MARSKALLNYSAMRAGTSPFIGISIKLKNKMIVSVVYPSDDVIDGAVSWSVSQERIY